jgi:hypothetical protein
MGIGSPRFSMMMGSELQTIVREPCDLRNAADDSTQVKSSAPGLPQQPLEHFDLPLLDAHQVYK